MVGSPIRSWSASGGGDIAAGAQTERRGGAGPAGGLLGGKDPAGRFSTLDGRTHDPSRYDYHGICARAARSDRAPDLFRCPPPGPAARAAARTGVFPCPGPALARRLFLMASPRIDNSSVTTRLIERAARGESESLGELLQRHRGRLRRMVGLRLDRRLQGRIDPSDVIQEASLEAAARLSEYVRSPTMPFFLWLRLLTGQRLQVLHRRHLGTRMRDAGREVALYRGALPEATSVALAAQLLGRDTRPSEAAVCAERKLRLQEALNSMDPLDREALALRHFEHLTTAEAAQVLGITPAAAGKRYLRALERLREILTQWPGGAEI